MNSKKLLEDSKIGKNPFEGYIPNIPNGETLIFGQNELFKHFENIGIIEFKHSAFVLVAGGLGERLGYSGIKIALPSESLTGDCFLKLYINSILDLQKASNLASGETDPLKMKKVPLVIMTSDDTNSRTVELLEKNNYFGMERDMLTIVKQEKVACLSDGEAHLALEKDPYVLQTKPHGHGDVHALLYQNGLTKKWLDEGRKWVVFFQDTNALVFKAIPSALGVSKTRDFDVNSLACPRKAKEAIGAICELVNDKTGHKMTLNVEYNQLDPLLRATIAPEGDTNDPKTGYSPFPGNLNELIMKLESYASTLHRTKGLTPEFVNPKYADATKTKFTSSTRLECMMQDYPRGLDSSAKVGFTILDTWASFSPVKNNPKDAMSKVKTGNPPACAASGECDQFEANSRILKMAGVKIHDPMEFNVNGIPLKSYPKIVFSASWCPTFHQLEEKLPGKDKIEITQRSCFVVKGEDIVIKSLKLDGALVIEAVPGAKVIIESLDVNNKGWDFVIVPHEDTSVPEEIRIRGFLVKKNETRILSFTTPGTYHVNN